MDARAEIGDEMTEGAGLPALVEPIEALGHAIGRRGDLIGIDRVALLAPAAAASQTISASPRRSVSGSSR